MPTVAPGNRVVDAAGLPIAALSVTGAANTIRGLRLRNNGANNRDVLSISGTNARGNLIERCIIELSGTADGVGIDIGAGGDFLATANWSATRRSQRPPTRGSKSPPMLTRGSRTTGYMTTPTAPFKRR